MEQPVLPVLPENCTSVGHMLEVRKKNLQKTWYNSTPTPKKVGEILGGLEKNTSTETGEALALILGEVWQASPNPESLSLLIKSVQKKAENP